MRVANVIERFEYEEISDRFSGRHTKPRNHAQQFTHATGQAATTADAHAGPIGSGLESAESTDE